MAVDSASVKGRLYHKQELRFIFKYRWWGKSLWVSPQDMGTVQGSANGKSHFLKGIQMLILAMQTVNVNNCDCYNIKLLKCHLEFSRETIKGIC